MLKAQPPSEPWSERAVQGHTKQEVPPKHDDPLLLVCFHEALGRLVLPNFPIFNESRHTLNDGRCLEEGCGRRRTAEGGPRGPLGALEVYLMAPAALKP